MSSSKVGGRKGSAQASPKGISAAPHKVLSAMAREGFSAFIVGGAIGFGVEVFVAATAQTSELVLVPDLQDRPLEGFVTQLDPASAQVHGHFPERSVQRDGGIKPYAARGAC